MKKNCLLLLFLFCFIITHAQKQYADSLASLLAKEKIDTNRVTYMWQMAGAVYIYNPDSAIILAQRALFLSRNIKYTEGESRSLGEIANAFLSIGNYPRALEYYIMKLKLEEKKNNPHNLASVTMNIGIVYVYQEEYEKALVYFREADSIITNNNVKDLKYNIALNIGDVYDRQNIADSSFAYFSKSLEIAKELKDGYLTGISMTGLAHVYLKTAQYDIALLNYKGALPYLESATAEDLICEATIGLAKLYDLTGQSDSSLFYARYSFALAQKDGFRSRQLEAANFLTEQYKKMKKTDSAFAYLEQVQVLKDSVNSKDRIRESQIISTNEQLRQEEIAENTKKAKEERSQQLQLLLIGIFIPALFLMTLLLSKRKIHIRVIKFLGIISLLILFEYLTLLLHPVVVEITHHTPLLELLIFVIIASLLIPTHHRIEHWLIEKLTIRKTNNRDGNLKFKRLRMKIKRNL
ncbi:tetratricopeptide repeat protein [Ferruginibacter sp. SUN106]|uniref:tetratricopeptide repeat protein n=1 Tax=Ferruginibacter sp. SUN106 TaxID=2978348 RepID=UPI003D362515